MGFFSHLDWNDPGAQQFLGTHAAFVVMLCLAKALDGGDGNRNGATKKTKQKWVRLNVANEKNTTVNQLIIENDLFFFISKNIWVTYIYFLSFALISHLRNS